MSNRVDAVPDRFWLLWIGYGLICLYFALFQPIPFASDSVYYYQSARAAIAAHTWFPHPDARSFSWIAAPVHVNLSLLFVQIWDSPITLRLLGVALNLLQLLLIFKLTQRCFDRQAAWVAAWLYVLYLNNVGLVLLNYTELTFGVFLLLSLWYFSQSPTLLNGLLTGITGGLALGVRPTFYPVLLIYGLVYAWNWWNNKPNHLQFAGIILGTLLYVIPAGMVAKQNVGKFVYTSTTGPANFVMSAFDGATGVFDDYIFKNDSVLLSKKTFYDKDAYLMTRSKAWIQQHPFRWISLWPRKLKATFSTDDISVSYLLNQNRWTLARWVTDRKLHEASRAFPLESRSFKCRFALLHGYHQFFYLVLLGLWGYQFIYHWQQKQQTPLLVWIVNGFTIMGLLLTFIGSVGNPRYKYSFLVASIIAIAPVIVFLKQKMMTLRNVSH